MARSYRYNVWTSTGQQGILTGQCKAAMTIKSGENQQREWRGALIELWCCPDTLQLAVSGVLIIVLLQGPATPHPPSTQTHALYTPKLYIIPTVNTCVCLQTPDPVQT